MDQLAKKTVSYFYDEEYANHSLGGCNPMRPHRVRLTNRLLEGYNMTGKMQVHRPRALDYDGLNYFHADGALLLLVILLCPCSLWRHEGARGSETQHKLCHQLSALENFFNLNSILLMVWYATMGWFRGTELPKYGTKLSCHVLPCSSTCTTRVQTLPTERDCFEDMQQLVP